MLCGLESVALTPLSGNKAVLDLGKTSFIGGSATQRRLEV